MNIDKIDRKILYELDLNARKPHTQIAKKLRINRNIVSYRINEMKKKGIIKGTFLELNNQLLGYYNVRLFIKFSNAKLDEIDSFIRSIKNDGRIMWLSSVSGKWDLDIVYMVKSIAEFNFIYEKIIEKNNQIIDGTHISILTKVKHYPKDYLIDFENKNRKHTTYISIEENAKIISEIDKQICAALSDNAEMPIVNLAKKLKISINTVKEHLKYLEKEEIISGYRLFYDTEKLGLRYYKVHINLKNYTPENARAIESWAFTKNYVIYNNKYLNGEDFELELHVEKESELINFKKELLKNYGEHIKEIFVIEFYDAKIFRCYPKE